MKTLLTDNEIKGITQVIDWHEKKFGICMRLDFTHNESYALYIHFQGIKVGFANFENAMTYLAGVQMGLKLISQLQDVA